MTVNIRKDDRGNISGGESVFCPHCHVDYMTLCIY